MEFLIFLNVITIAIAYLILGLPARRLRRRLNEAEARLADTSVEKGIRARFVAVRADSAQRAITAFWIGLSVFIVGLTFGFQLYAASVEPGAQLWNWMLLYLMIYGLALLGVAVLLSALISVYWQSYRTSALINTLTRSHPNSPVLREVRDAITPNVGELGVSVIAALTVVACALYGLVLIAVFYMAAQTAIECARSSKCM